jgi:serine/threonine protein kinase
MVGALKGQPGQTLDGRFLLVEAIAQGGMSTIFKAEDLQNGNAPVVVKVPLPMFSSGLGAWSMFQREEEIGRQLDHPYILKFLPLAIDKRRSYLVTEYVPGITLAERLKRDRVLDQTEALVIAAKVCEAIHYLHEQQFVHYDLKPANVILCPDKTIRLIDFGLAHAAVTARRFSLSAPAPAIGTSEYIAPEQIRRQRGRKSVDIYGVGAMLYEMLTGRAPFPDDDPFIVASARLIGDPPAPRSLNPDISAAAEEIVLRALRRDPADRYPSAAAMKDDLDHPERVVVSGICDRLQPVTRWRRTLRLVRYIAMTGLVPVALLLAMFRLLWWYFERKT